MLRRTLLWIDLAINLLLGLLLVLFPPGLVTWLGMPTTDQRFYPMMLGSIFVGIAVALSFELARKPESTLGLQLGGAVAINLCGALMLAGWLIVGRLSIPLHGRLLLWGLAAILVGLSAVELLSTAVEPKVSGG